MSDDGPCRSAGDDGIVAARQGAEDVKPLSPFFKYFGSKRNAAKLYQAPRHDMIVEPFAGSAGYSLNYYDRDVYLYDADARVVAIWEYLIGATADEIMAIPLLEYGQKIESLGIGPGPAALLSCWVNTSPFCTQMSGWKAEAGVSLCGLWGKATQETVASQVDKIRHWKIINCDYRIIANTEATWFIDPPYQSLQEHYRESKRNPIDFENLARWCKSRDGQVIVCEKHGADWLPFRYLGQASAARGSKKCLEAVWTNQPDKQLSLFEAP